MSSSRSSRFSLLRLRPGRRTVRRNLVALLLTLVASAIAISLEVQQVSSLYKGSPLYALESSAQDTVLRSRDPSVYGSSVGQDPRRVITIVAMDDKSIAELGVFRNWTRDLHARMVDNLLAGRPRAIVFDVGFFDPAPEDPVLVEAFQRARSLVPPAAIVIAAAGGGQGQATSDGSLTFTRGLQPVPAIAAVADIASANVVPDDLGVVRSMPLLTRLGDADRPSLGLAAVAKYLRRPNFQVARPEPDTVDFVGRKIPVNRAGMVRVNYFGPPSDARSGAATFNVVSFVDVLESRADPATWRNGLVFVGLLGATGFADDYWTPVSVEGAKMSGVEIHANLAATLFSTQYLREAPLPLNVALVAGLALLVALLAANLGVLLASATALAAIAAFAYGNLLTLNYAGLQLSLANPVLGALLAFVAITGYRVMVEQRQARALRGALASVIPPSVANEIAKDPDRVKMGGERRTISVLFTDLKGFTTFSEQVEPELLSRVIAEYLNAMTAVVFRYGGTVDKFIGDAVMAFWNAPLDDPDHALHACEAALEMQRELRRLGEKWEAEGLPRQYMRVGINTGPASVGNMGTAQRFAYTALGDTVNLGARLEPLNNEYGTWICISEATLDAAGRDRLLVRFLDLVAVKGKKEPVPVFELIGESHDAELKARYDPILVPYGRAMLLYQARQFEEAHVLFQAAMQASAGGTDQPSAVYVDRCWQLAKAPPSPEWDGVCVMHHK